MMYRESIERPTEDALEAIDELAEAISAGTLHVDVDHAYALAGLIDALTESLCAVDGLTLCMGNKNAVTR